MKYNKSSKTYSYLLFMNLLYEKYLITTSNGDGKDLEDAVKVMVTTVKETACPRTIRRCVARVVDYGPYPHIGLCPKLDTQ